jgi:transcriptional regulator with XRE-family HTH domain
MDEYTLEDFIAEEIAADPTFAEGLAKAEEEARFAIELSRLREARGLTQAELAIALGVKQPQVARIERGQVPTLATLALLARMLGAEFTIGPQGGISVKRCEPWLPPEGVPSAPRGPQHRATTVVGGGRPKPTAHPKPGTPAPSSGQYQIRGPRGDHGSAQRSSIPKPGRAYKVNGTGSDRD